MNEPEASDWDQGVTYYGVCLNWPGWESDPLERRLHDAFCREVQRQLDEREPGRFRLDARGQLREQPDWRVGGGNRKLYFWPRNVFDLLRNAFRGIFPDRSFPEFGAPVVVGSAKIVVEPSQESVKRSTRKWLRDLLGSGGSSAHVERVPTPPIDADDAHAEGQIQLLQTAFADACSDRPKLVEGLRRWLHTLRRQREPRSAKAVFVPNGRRPLALKINGHHVHVGSNSYFATLEATPASGIKVLVTLQKDCAASPGDLPPFLNGLDIEVDENGIQVSVRGDRERCQMTCIEKEADDCEIVWDASEPQTG